MGTDSVPVPTPISPTVGPAEGVSVFSGQGVGLQRSGCRFGAAYASACLENVEYLPDRGLKQEELLRFGTCNYIQEHHNIILLGATGSGKTYLACALGMAAARRFFAVKYIVPYLSVSSQQNVTL